MVFKESLLFCRGGEKNDQPLQVLKKYENYWLKTQENKIYIQQLHNLN